MKKICFFIGSMSQGGGTEHMTQLLANALVNKGYEILILSRRDKCGKSFYVLDERIEYHILDNEIYQGLKTLIKDIFILRKFIRDKKIDVLIVADVSLGIFTIPLRFLCSNLKQIYWDHFNVNYDVENKRMRKIRKCALRYGDIYVTLTKDDEIDILKLEKKHCTIKTIPNICAYEISSEPYDVKSKTIISAGNMLFVKGFDMAIDAATIVLRKHQDWKWIIYGDGPELENLKLKAKRSKVDSNLQFRGRVKNLEEAYKNAAFFVLTSRSEGFGLVIVEAQAFHLPVIAFDVPYGPRNLIQSGVNGMLIEPENVLQLSQSINDLIEDDEKRIRFALNATESLCKYSEKNIVDMWIEVIGE